MICISLLSYHIRAKIPISAPRQTEVRGGRRLVRRFPPRTSVPSLFLRPLPAQSVSKPRSIASSLRSRLEICTWVVPSRFAVSLWVLPS